MLTRLSFSLSIGNGEAFDIIFVQTIALEVIESKCGLKFVVEFNETEVIYARRVLLRLFGKDPKGLVTGKWAEDVSNFSLRGIWRKSFNIQRRGSIRRKIGEDGRIRVIWMSKRSGLLWWMTLLEWGNQIRHERDGWRRGSGHFTWWHHGGAFCRTIGSHFLRGMSPVCSGMGSGGIVREMDGDSVIVFGPFVTLKSLHCEGSTFGIFKIGESYRMAVSILSKSCTLESLLGSENGDKFFEDNVGRNISDKKGGGRLYGRIFHDGRQERGWQGREDKNSEHTSKRSFAPRTSNQSP